MLTLNEIYQDEAVRRQGESYMWRNGGVERCLEYAKPLGELATPADVIQHVEGLPEYDWNDTRERAARLLCALPAPTLLYNFGEEIMGWTVANAESRLSQDLRTSLEDEGYEADLLGKARTMAWQDRKPPQGGEVIRQNAVAEAMLSGALDKVDLPSLLRAAALPGQAISDKRAGDYKLIPLRAEAGDFRPGGYVWGWEGHDKANRPGLHYKLFIDTPTGYALMYKGIPQFVIGMAAGMPDELQMRQFQRWYGQRFDHTADKPVYNDIRLPRGLVVLDWEQLAIGITGHLAAGMGKDYVGLRAGDKIPSPDSRLTRAEAREAYDGAAQRFHFEPNEKGDWRLPVAAILG